MDSGCLSGKSQLLILIPAPVQCPESLPNGGCFPLVQGVPRLYLKKLPYIVHNLKSGVPKSSTERKADISGKNKKGVGDRTSEQQTQKF